jgi:hypothetical protein
MNKAGKREKNYLRVQEPFVVHNSYPIPQGGLSMMPSVISDIQATRESKAPLFLESCEETHFPIESPKKGSFITSPSSAPSAGPG